MLKRLIRYYLLATLLYSQIGCKHCQDTKDPLTPDDKTWLYYSNQKPKYIRHQKLLDGTFKTDTVQAIVESGDFLTHTGGEGGCSHDYGYGSTQITIIDVCSVTIQAERSTGELRVSAQLNNIEESLASQDTLTVNHIFFNMISHFTENSHNLLRPNSTTDAYFVKSKGMIKVIIKDGTYCELLE